MTRQIAGLVLILVVGQACASSGRVGRLEEELVQTKALLSEQAQAQGQRTAAMLADLERDLQATNSDLDQLGRNAERLTALIDNIQSSLGELLADQSRLDDEVREKLSEADERIGEMADRVAEIRVQLMELRNGRLDPEVCP